MKRILFIQGNKEDFEEDSLKYSWRGKRNLREKGRKPENYSLVNNEGDGKVSKNTPKNARMVNRSFE